MVSFCLKQGSIHLRLMVKPEDILLRLSLHIGHEDIYESGFFSSWGSYICVVNGCLSCVTHMPKVGIY